MENFDDPLDLLDDDGDGVVEMGLLGAEKDKKGDDLKNRSCCVALVLFGSFFLSLWGYDLGTDDGRDLWI